MCSFVIYIFLNACESWTLTAELAAIGEYGKLLTLVKKRKLRWFGRVSRSSGLAKIILQGKNKKNNTVFLLKNAASDNMCIFLGWCY